MTDILVIGASGFLGSEIVRKYISTSCKVWGTFNQNPGTVPEHCSPLSIDDLASLDTEIDLIIFAAGNHAQTYSEMINTNVLLVARVTSQFPSTRIVYISSVAVYGHHDDVISLNSEFVTPSPYGLAKLAGEAVVAAHPKHAIIRLTYLYGPTMPQNSFLPAIMRSANETGTITLFGSGSRLQDYLHIDDAVELCFQVGMRNTNNIYLGATGVSVSNKTIADTISANIDCTVAYMGNDIAASYRFDIQTTTSLLQWRPSRNVLQDIQGLL